MQIVYIRKKTFINIVLILVFVLVSLFYTKSFKGKMLGVFLNNEREMPIYCVDIPDKRISLTFDTAWGDQYTREIIDILKRYNIKTTFFVTGAWADKYPDIVLEISKNGNEIGNHSTTHVKMTEISKSSIESEVKETQAKLEKITNLGTTLFRIPFGEYNNKIVTAIKTMNYNIIQWDIDSLDWKGINAEEILARVTTKAGNGSIVLLHSNTANTVKVLPKIIENLREKGYKFVTVSELIIKENYYIDNTGRQRPIK